MLRKRMLSLLSLIIVLTLSLSSPAFAVPDKSKKKKEKPKGTPVLWREPEDVSSRNLFLGPGGAALRPTLRNIKFIEEEKGGYSKKYRIRDGAGREWVAKIGKEAQAETAAVRLLWAVGYVTEINYLVPRMTIPGKGVFENVRLEARPKGIKRVDEWKWDENPFVGTKEFQGLKVMMLLFNNWDIKDSNNEILHVPGARGSGDDRLYYVVSDLGATFGKTGSGPIVWRFTRSRNNPEDYADSKFLDEVKGNRVFFHPGGKKQDIFEDITVDEASWIGARLSRLTNAQIADAFRAANYSPEQIRMLTRAVRTRIEELASVRQQVGERR